MLKEAKPILRRRSPLEEALKYAEVYNELTVVSKTQVAMRFGVSRARVCQVMNLLDLDDAIKKYLLSIQDAKEHNYFTERRLTQVAIINDREAQIREFDKLVTDMRVELNGEID